MNYRHIYHAGNFADFMKHIILVAIVEKLKEKDKPFTVLDAFAGIGIYDLTSKEAQKTSESLNGIGAVLHYVENMRSIYPEIPISSREQHNTPFLLDTYLSIIKILNDTAILEMDLRNEPRKNVYLYPGSPYIISHLLRNQDELIISELHPQDYSELKYNIKSRFKDTAIHHLDGYNAIKAFLPPKNNRGLVFLDAAFEVKNEYLKIIDSLKLIKKHFSAGIVMIWYPLKDLKLIENFYSSVQNIGYTEFLKIEFEIKDDSCAMNKCGVLVANPPNIQAQMDSLFHYISQNIYKNQAKYSIELLT